MATEQEWTVGRLLDWTQKYLGQKGSEFPRLDTEVLLAHSLGCRRIDLYTRFEESAGDAVRQKFRDLIQERVKGCPVAYLVGRKEFFSLEFEVTRDVLIPRPDTECVVDECLRLARGVAAPVILDVGAGSGCLPVALAKQHKTATFTAIDISEKALAVARRNAAKHGVVERIRFLLGDLLTALPDDATFDFIVSNPPYIGNSEIATLEAGVRDFEPHVALDGGPTGFEVFDRLIAGAVARLNSGGYLIVEIGAPQEATARRKIEAIGEYELAATIRDSAGHPRVLRARRKS